MIITQLKFHLITLFNFDETVLEDNLEQPVTRSANATDNLVNEDRDEAMDAGEDDVGQTSGKSASSRQNEKLYAEEGMLNNKLRKAEKKRMRKDKASTTSDMMDDDYDFKVDYFSKESIMDNAKDDVITGESKKNRFEIPSGLGVSWIMNEELPQ